MPTQPTESQLIELQSALLSAFDHTTLDRFARANLGEDLPWVTPAANSPTLRQMVEHLVRYYAAQAGGLQRLLLAAQEAQPTNEPLHLLAGDWANCEFAPLPLPADHPSVQAGERGVAAGGNISDSTLITGDSNTLNQVDTGGGPYVGGNVIPDRDFVSRDQTIHGSKFDIQGNLNIYPGQQNEKSIAIRAVLLIMAGVVSASLLSYVILGKPGGSTNSSQFTELITEALRFSSGGPVSFRFAFTTTYAILAVVILFIIWALLYMLSGIRKLWVDEFSPLFYDREEQDRRDRRQLFAKRVVFEIQERNEAEEWQTERWNDTRYTELEAHVEAEGRRRIFSWLPLNQRTKSGLRHEPSLSKALEASRERLILLEGEPGSGKSIALRHFALSLAQHASNSRSTKTIIPILVNLRELKRKPGEAIDRNLIQAFILRSVNPDNDDKIDKFLADEFDRGLREGAWFFLFDSFDELPEVLSSTEADDTIRRYGQAIQSFIGGMHQCRGVVASRPFRGPGGLQWPHFRILPLTEKRLLRFIHNVGLKPQVEEKLIGQLKLPDSSVSAMASNPLFLRLICDYMKVKQSFPDNVHAVFETYIEMRLQLNALGLRENFNLEAADVRSAAEKIAFCMTADSGLGLNPTVDDVKASTKKFNLDLGANFDAFMNALQQVKLARIQPPHFTFTHRRFQEYFTTCLVLRESGRVQPEQLLTDARWRETAVVMCQTQSKEDLEPFCREVRSRLTEIVRYASDQNEQKPVESAQNFKDEQKQHWRDWLRKIIKRKPASVELSDQNGDAKKIALLRPFAWPPGAIYLLSLLQDGFGGRLPDLADDIRVLAGRLLLLVNQTGTLLDRKWGLEVAGVVPQAVLKSLLLDAFSSQSLWLQGVAYWQAVRLAEIPPEIAIGIRLALIRLTLEGRLPQERYATYAHLSRLNKPERFLSTLQLLLWAPQLDLALHGLVIALPWAILMSLGRAERTVDLEFILNLILVSPIILVIAASSYRLVWKWQKYYGDIDGLTNLIRLVPAGILALSLSYYLASDFTAVAFFFTLSVYLVFWAPLALESAVMGRFNKIFLWPCIPFILFYGLAKAFVKYVVPWFLALSVIALIGVIVFSFLRKYMDVESTYDILTSRLESAVIHPIAESLAPAILITVWLSLVSLGIVFVIVTWVRDWLRSFNPLEDRQTPITGTEFLEMLRQYRYTRFRLKFIKFVHQHRSLNATDEAETLLRNLALMVEVAQRGQGKLTEAEIRQIARDNDPSAQLEVFHHWLEKNAKRLYELGGEFLDEVYMLIEQIQMTRRSQQ